MLKRLSMSVRWSPVILVLVVAGCAEPPQRTAANDPYEACLARGYQIGDLPYSATRFYQSHVEDRIWTPARSPVSQCNEYRARGEL
jgi:hypothetical protein